MAASSGKPIARKVELPAPVHVARGAYLAPTAALGTINVHGGFARTVSSKLPVFAGTLRTIALTPPVALLAKASGGLCIATRESAVLNNIEPFSMGWVIPIGVSCNIESARLMTSFTVPAAQVATRWIAGARVGTTG